MCIKPLHVKKINDILYKYIWNRNYAASKAPDRIKREIMATSVKRGGFGMLDILDLDNSLKLRALGRLFSTKHPFLVLIRDRLNMDSFFNPNLRAGVEKVALEGIKILGRERKKVLSIKNLENDRRLLSTIRAEKIRDLLSPNGKNSLQYFMLYRAGKRVVGDMNQGDYNLLNRQFIERSEVIKRAINTNVEANNLLRLSFYCNGRFRELLGCSSGDIRRTISTKGVITNWKVGINLSQNSSLTYGLRISKLTSTQHKSYLLRIAHGDVYTKEKQFRYNLSDSPLCARCNQLETLRHKIYECDYARRIWNTAFEVLSLDPNTDLLEKIMGAHPECNPMRLPLHVEILKRIILLREDENFLMHPKAFVKSSLESLILKEKGRQFKMELKSLLESYLSRS
jgi:hypothetical protein